MRKKLLWNIIILVILGTYRCTPVSTVRPLTQTPPQTATLALPSPTFLPSPTQQSPSSPTSSSTSPTISPEQKDTLNLLEALGGYPCPDSDFTCVSLRVPIDHFASNDETIEVVFAVLPASGERKGLFVTAVGGPGGSGISVADTYTSYLDPSIPEHFDIVFFDQRGVGLSGGLQCVQAATEFYRADWRALTPEEEKSLTQTAQKFVESCIREMQNPELLPYLGTAQAIEDLEIFRQVMQEDKFWLYGESYGTQFAQTYAAKYPEHLAGLILDGTVDLTLSGVDYYKEQAQAFHDVLLATLESCNNDESCASDVEKYFGQEGSLKQFYDELASRLTSAPIRLNFPLPSGGFTERELTFPDLETAAANYLYSEGARMLLLRALAAAARNDYVPLTRLLYDSLGLDPETLQPIPDPTYSDAVYYAVECIDYDYGSDETEYLRAGDELDRSLPYFSSIFYGDLPCVFWPDQMSTPERPAPLTADGVPTLVLAATADPATPIANSYRVFNHLKDGYLIVMEGGPHIIFGWGNPCPDDLVTDFLVEEITPSQRKITCEGVIADAYVSLPPLDASEFSSPLEALQSFDTELQYLPEYYYWDYESSKSVGCSNGGVVTFDATDEGETFTFDQCAFSQGFIVTGSGFYDYAEDLFTMQVMASGYAHGDLAYQRASDGSVHVTGTYAGEAIDLSE